MHFVEGRPCKNNPIDHYFSRKIAFHTVTGHCALRSTQKHAAALFVPGELDASGISASARSAQARASRQCAAATAPPTTTSANSACRPARRRGESTWSSTAAVMKVGNGLGGCVIMLNQLAIERVSLSLSSDLWHIFHSCVDSHNSHICQQQANAANDGVKVTMHVHQ